MLFFIKLGAPNPSLCSYIHLCFSQTLLGLKVLKSNWLNVTELCAESGPSHGKKGAESLDAARLVGKVSIFAMLVITRC